MPLLPVPFEGERSGHRLPVVRRGAPRGLLAGERHVSERHRQPWQWHPRPARRQIPVHHRNARPERDGPAGRRFVDDYATKYGTSTPDPYAIDGYESMALLLDAIKRADASGGVSRQAVVDDLFRTRNRVSVLGNYSIDANGDTSLTDYGLYKIAGGQLTFDEVVRGVPGG
jgi:branched-chain amino acid transport system substrate-binding protein